MRALVLLLATGTLAAHAASAGVSNLYQQSGNLGVSVQAAAGGNAQIASGTFTNPVPIGATVLRARLYACDVNNSHGMTATFGGSGTLGPVGVTSDAALLTLSTFEWDVMPYVVPGPLSFSYQATSPGPSGGQVGAVALVVVWQSASEPNRTITVLHGMQQVGESGPETESVTFNGLPAGPTTAWIVTAYDDNTDTGEVVKYNGSTIGGPIDQNLGMNASLLQLTTTSNLGSNALSITSGPAPADHMGWMIAATEVTTGVTEARRSTWGRIKGLYR